MPDRILVINPNSTDAVTGAIDDAMAPLRITGGSEIACMTLREGPPGVESQEGCGRRHRAALPRDPRRRARNAVSGRSPSWPARRRGICGTSPRWEELPMPDLDQIKQEDQEALTCGSGSPRVG